MASVMVSWMRGCCRTLDMIYLSLPRSTSDMGLKEEGKIRKNTCTIAMGELAGPLKYLQSKDKRNQLCFNRQWDIKTLKYGQTPPCIMNGQLFNILYC